MSIVLFDLDNTLSDARHRWPLITQATPDWDAFESECNMDPPILPTIQIARYFDSWNHKVWIWTGRSDNVKGKTIQWLNHHNVPFDQLLMRPHGNHQGTASLKESWLTTIIPKDRVICAYDDDPGIVRMLLNNNVTCYQICRP